MGYTFKDITDELFKQIKSEDWTEQDVVHNFYISQTKNFKEIISTINLEEEIEWIKTGGNFSFNESDRDFWINVLKDFTKKMDPLRRADYSKVDNGFVVWLFEGVIEVFRNAGLEDDRLEIVAKKMNTRVNYSMRKRRFIIESMQVRMQELIEENVDSVSCYLGVTEKYQWLLGLENDFYQFISKWLDLFYLMKEIRCCEMGDIIEQAANEMSLAETYEAHVDFVIAEVLSKRLNENTEYSSLYDQRNRMLGISESIEENLALSNGESLPKNKPIKKPHVAKVERKFMEINKRLQYLFMDIRQQVIKEFFPNYTKEAYEEKDPDYSSLMPVEELLEMAIKQQKEAQEDDDMRKTNPSIDLPDIDFEALRKQLEYQKLL
ncbi:MULTISPECIES: hypothetical protein [Paenibacillus]|uniref:hypothetical protein n=1 Tax=Paenibacillus TaxID=44249 RepID=UPI00096C6007|nr:hypothetical protein [Paenibacillus odorifer]OME11120.1 hypothetical protein BSK60_22165 [Paenibacillus odorifer]